MKSALIDNSTITAVQRLTGEIPVQSDFRIEGDVSAFDQYLQALLLYDRVAAVSDYKPEHSVNRTESFSELVFLNSKEEFYTSSVSASRDITRDVYLEVKAGETQAGLVKDLLSSLDLHLSPAWYQQSSDWFLRLRLLSDHADVNLPKYGALMTAIFNQLNENTKSANPVRWAKSLLTRAGKSIPDRSGVGRGNHEVVNGDVKAFSAGLNWLTERSIFYLLLSHKLDASCVTHPIRHTFLANFFVKELDQSATPDIRGAFLRRFAADLGNVNQGKSEMLGRLGSFSTMPFIAAWAVAHAGNPKNARNHVLEIRASPEALRLRQTFSEIEDALRHNDPAGIKSLTRLYQALNDDVEVLKRQFRRASEDDLSVSFSLATAAVSLSSKSASRRIRSFIPNSSKRSVALLRNITSDLVLIPTLGRVADDMTKSLNHSKESEYFSNHPKIDPFRFARSTSHWKRPME